MVPGTRKVDDQATEMGVTWFESGDLLADVSHGELVDEAGGSERRARESGRERGASAFYTRAPPSAGRSHRRQVAPAPSHLRRTVGKKEIRTSL